MARMAVLVGALAILRCKVLICQTTAVIGPTLLTWAAASAAFKPVIIGKEFLDPDLVIGIEADLDYAGIAGTLKSSPAEPFEARTNLHAIGTLIRGRLGYAGDQALFYGMEGIALGDVEDTLLCNDSLGKSFSLDNTTTRTGYVAGGGVGLTLTPNWSLKVEYQLLRLESLSAFGTFAGSEITDAVRTSDPGCNYHTIKAGLNYHAQANYQPFE